MESSFYEWVGARERYRGFLFGDSTELTPKLGDVALAPLTTLAFTMLGSAHPSNDELLMQTELVDATHAILTHHNAMAASDSGAVFGIGSREDLEYIAGLTAGVIFRWARACGKGGRASPFANLNSVDYTDADFERQDVQMVVEAASAVLEVLGLGYTSSPDVTTKSHKYLVNLVARRGPVVVAAWATGDTVRAYCDAQGEDAVAILGSVSRARLASFLIRNPRDPLQALLRYNQNLAGSLSLESLIAELGEQQWSPQRIAAVFTPNTCRLLAYNWPNPMLGAKRLAHVMDTVLTTDAIAGALGEEPESVDRLFLHRDRLRAALSANPLRVLKRMAANFKLLTVDALEAKLGWEREEVEKVFTSSYCRKLASVADLEGCLRKIAASLDDELSVCGIAKSLGWTEEQTASIFTLRVRRDIALQHRDPVRRVLSVAATRDQLLQGGPQLPIEIINLLSVRYCGPKAYSVACIVHAELSRCPPKVGRGLWARVVARQPTASKETWLRNAAAFHAFLKVVKPVSLSRPSWNSKELGEYIPDPASNFVDDILSDEPGVYLQDLAVRAGVPYGELQRLLKSFEADTQDLSADDLELLGRLRGVAAKIA